MFVVTSNNHDFILFLFHSIQSNPTDIEPMQLFTTQVPRGKWLCVICQAKSPPPKKRSSSNKKSTAQQQQQQQQQRDRVSESDSSTTGAPHCAESIAESNSLTCGSPASAASGTATSSAAPSPRRSSSAVALKRSLNQAIAKEKDLAPCRYKG